MEFLTGPVSNKKVKERKIGIKTYVYNAKQILKCIFTLVV
jgi:hypothetical protein